MQGIGEGICRDIGEDSMRLYANRCEIQMCPLKIGRKFDTASQFPKGSRQGRMINRNSREIKAHLRSRGGGIQFCTRLYCTDVIKESRWQEHSQSPTKVCRRCMASRGALESSSVVEC